MRELDGEPSEPTVQSRPGQAILVIDLVDSVLLMQRHEFDALARWLRFVEEVRAEVLPALGLRLVKSLGDGLRIIGPSAPPLVAAAQEMNRRLQAYNTGRDADALLRLHAAVHVADLVENDIDIHGHGVNIAARLAAHSAAGEVLVTTEANEQLLPGLDPTSEDLGDVWVKGLTESLRAYRVGAVSQPGETLVAPHDEAQVLRPAIAVLPFESAAEDGIDAWLGELVADELICALSTGRARETGQHFGT